MTHKDKTTPKGERMIEEWKEIDGYPNYLVSNFGQIYSYRRDRLLKTSLDDHGYFCVHLCNGNLWVRRSIHRLVAFAFVDGYFEGAVANHIDGVKQNNIASNFEWITQGDNTRHAFATGLVPRQFRIIETGDTFWRPESCAGHIGGNPDAILKCLNGTMKTHKGYTFEYVN